MYFEYGGYFVAIYKERKRFEQEKNRPDRDETILLSTEWDNLWPLRLRDKNRERETFSSEQIFSP